MTPMVRPPVFLAIDNETNTDIDTMSITNARLLGVLIGTLSPDIAASLIKSRVLTTNFSKASILALNAVLLTSPEALAESFADETVSVICQGIAHNVCGSTFLFRDFALI